MFSLEQHVGTFLFEINYGIVSMVTSSAAYMTTLNPHYVSGFVDGQGCFSVQIGARKEFRLGIEVRPSFSVSQGSSSRDLIEKISLFFNSANSNIRADQHVVIYETRKLKHILTEVIPHFERYPLASNKQNDFLKFRRVCSMLKQKDHLTKDGIKDILKIAYSMNLDSQFESRRRTSEEEWLKLLESK